MTLRNGDVNGFLKELLNVYDVSRIHQNKLEVYSNALGKVKSGINKEKLEEIIAMYDKLPLPYELALAVIDCDYSTVSAVLKDINYSALKSGAYHFKNKCVAYVLKRFCKNQENIAVYVYDKFMLNKFISYELDNILRQFYKEKVVTGEFEDYDYYGMTRKEEENTKSALVVKHFCFDEVLGKKVCIKEEKFK